MKKARILSPKGCNHTSVGMLVWQGDRLLLIERKKFPFGFAPPAGHCDGDDYESAAKRELEEEVGLKPTRLKLVFEGRRENPCRRPGGTWHYWKIYQVEAEGEVKRSLEETKQTGWYLKEEIKNLAERTKRYLDGKISEEDWQKSPGIEPVWYELFKQLGII
ncbi:MAG: NUDIX hydrolase [Microgenomates group bacterium]